MCQYIWQSQPQGAHVWDITVLQLSGITRHLSMDNQIKKINTDVINFAANCWPVAWLQLDTQQSIAGQLMVSNQAIDCSNLYFSSNSQTILSCYFWKNSVYKYFFYFCANSVSK
jgi:hypothetical protein